MRFVTLARKPLAESNVAQSVLNTGTGALHIDPCRIATQENRARFNKARTQGSSYVVQKETLYIDPGGDGRFPSNLVLEHKRGCAVEGTRKVKTGTAVRRHVGHSTKGLIAYAQGSHDEGMRDDVSYAGKDGTEAVENWICEKGCPVKGLDDQSGFLANRGNLRPERTGGGMFGHPEFSRESPLTYDSGGASRFFKQVQNG